MKPNYLGIDAGGSRTRWVLCPVDGDPLAAGEVDSIQPAVDGIEVATASLRALWARIEAAHPSAAEAVVGAVAGVAGVADRATAEALAGAVRAPLHVVDDLAIAAASSGRAGVAIQAGTGSFAVARSATGFLHRRGGLGWLCDDGGSAVDLVLRAVRRLVAAADGRPRSADVADAQLPLRSALVGALASHFGADATEPARLGAAIQRLEPRRIAAAAKTVLDHAAHGDPFAVSVGSAGADELASLGIAALTAADFDPTGPVGRRVVVGGGLLQGSPWYRERCADALRARGVPVEECVPGLPGAIAAARLAVAIDQRVAPMCDWVRWR